VYVAVGLRVGNMVGVAVAVLVGDAVGKTVVPSGDVNVGMGVPVPVGSGLGVTVTVETVRVTVKDICAPNTYRQIPSVVPAQRTDASSGSSASDKTVKSPNPLFRDVHCRPPSIL